MAYTTINKSTDYFNTKLWTGTGSSGAKGVTGVGFQPDFLWIKNRSASQEHWLADAVRGTTKFIESNSSNAESSDGATGLASFDSDGFTLGTGSNRTNQDGSNMVAWNWKAGTTGSGSTTGSGTSKTYNYSVNTTAGFSITKYTGNGNSGHTIPHSLGTTPKIVIVKELSATDYWRVYHPALTANYNLYLNTNHAQDSASDGYVASVGSTTFGFGGSSNTNTVNQDGNDYIAYCFAEKTGYSKFGSYAPNGSSDGNFIYTGFAPSFFLIKNTNTTRNWLIFDNKRNTSNETTKSLEPNTSDAEQTDSGLKLDLLSNGAKLRGAGGDMNTGDGVEYIYMAFGQSLVGSNNVPCTAR